MGVLGFLLCTNNLSKKQITGEQHNANQSNEKKKKFNGCLDLTADDILKSPAELLGKGSCGTTYKVTMDNGSLLVVKRIPEPKKKKIDGLLNEIGELRHKNLSSLRGYCSWKEELLLVYDYLSNGSLYSLLHGDRGPGRILLDWPTRVGHLAFLHAVNDRKLFHGSLTSDNVVIDRENNACIADSALCHIFVAPADVAHNGYKAPELTHKAKNYRKFSQKCDVYSFGVILLEILTGKTALHEGETSLVKWVQCVVGRKDWEYSELFDFELERDKVSQGEMVGILQIALECVTRVPNDRPNMSVGEFLQLLSRNSQLIKDVDANNHSTDSSHSQLSNDALPAQNSSF
ncbi:hypothetical protein MKW92_046675 [Papaver armeniacum]|nr:hypothetical protein MKW92_046675 [Papaver armeniacum]